jgi:uncharacterized repeat protein (TIGR03803 family)
MTRSEQHRGSMMAGIAIVAGLFILLVTAGTARAQTLRVLHTFTGKPDGSLPYAGLIRDGAGNLYGTTYRGGVNGCGMVFELAHSGSGWIERSLYSFGCESDGAFPYAPVVIGPDGSLYGTTEYGGGDNDDGIVFKISPPPHFCRSFVCPWIETILYRFTGGSDGGQPVSPVIFDNAGNVYGTAQRGGSANQGVVFKLTRTGSSWTESVPYSFAGPPDGGGPTGGLVFDAAGNLYGTTYYGGNIGLGTAFQLSPSGSGWTEIILQNFGSSSNGNYPYSGLIIDDSGNLYGTTEFGPIGDGTVFELAPSGGQWTFTTIYNLMSGFAAVAGPVGPLVRDASGNLYGTTVNGGIICEYGCGTVFELSPVSGGWTYNLLYEFMGGSDGSGPDDGLVRDAEGNLYGTASGVFGGNSTVFELTP